MTHWLFFVDRTFALTKICLDSIVMFLSFRGMSEKKILVGKGEKKGKDIYKEGLFNS